MGSRIDLIAAKTRLDMAGESLAAAYWTKSPYHVERAREDIVRAIIGRHDADFVDLASFFEARAVIPPNVAADLANALLKALVPDLIEEPAKETA